MDHYRGGREEGKERCSECEEKQRERERDKGSRKLEIVNRERHVRKEITQQTGEAEYISDVERNEVEKVRC